MIKNFFFNTFALLVILFLSFIALKSIPHKSLKDDLLFGVAYYDKDGKLLRLKTANDEIYRLWTSLNEISPELINGVLLHEDKYFYKHFGFNPYSLLRGAYVSYVKKVNMQGGSTLTMQLARMKWKLNTRTISGKITQILRAIELEFYYSKDEILESYFNYAPYGRNIEGIGAASLIYFDKKPNELNLHENLTLAVLPQSPSFRVDKNSEIISLKLKKVRDELFLKYKQKYSVDKLSLALFSQPLLLRQPENLPFIAPHFVQKIDNINFDKAYKSSHIFTSLDTKLQNILNTQIKAYINTKQNEGIKNAAALLLDTKTQNIVAYIGSSDFFNKGIKGQVDGVNSKRSPGSILKPFIYALAIEQGIIHPKSVLKDVPSSFGAYSPENFDYTFNGPLDATKALIKSRNIPAVYLSSKLHNPNLYAFLKEAKIEKMQGESHYGLALSLGGGEVTMLEVARLYSILSNGGLMYDLNFFKDETKTNEVQLLSKESAFLTLEMLKENPELGSSIYQKKTLPIYWKTGTSWGFKDAWSVGVVGEYILVVWLGNFDNLGNTAFIGNNVAAPLFFNIVNALRATTKLNDINQNIPKRVKKVEICLSSGDLSTVWCQKKGETWFIAGVSPIKVDNVYRPVLMDKKTKKPLCPNEKNKNSYLEVFEYYSSDILDIFNKAGLSKRTPPDLSHCDEFSLIGTSVYITSPLKNVTYTLKENRQKIIFSASADASVKTLFWFLDEEFIGESNPYKSLEYTPKRAGIFTIKVVDDHGRSDMQTIKIEFGL